MTLKYYYCCCCLTGSFCETIHRVNWTLCCIKWAMRHTFIVVKNALLETLRFAEEKTKVDRSVWYWSTKKLSARTDIAVRVGLPSRFASVCNVRLCIVSLLALTVAETLKPRSQMLQCVWLCHFCSTICNISKLSNIFSIMQSLLSLDFKALV